MGVAVELRDQFLGGRSTAFDVDGNLVRTVNGTTDINYAEEARQATEKTIATTSTTDFYLLAPFAGKLSSVDFSGIDALAANDANYITFSITNLGQAGAGSTAMLAATDANTTKATGGSAIAANTKRALSLHGTAANLVVAKGDRLRVRATATGTLANTVTGSVVSATFIRTA